MLTYEELLAENKRLSEEVSNLKTENAELKARLGIVAGPLITHTKHEEEIQKSHIINKYSSPDAKIVLFKSLFRGRTDVFARRWYGVMSGKSGYQPVCGNEWDEMLCDKKKYRCAECPNRKLMQLSDSDIFAHLVGKDKYARDVVGVYPMLTDETCAFSVWILMMKTLMTLQTHIALFVGKTIFLRMWNAPGQVKELTCGSFLNRLFLQKRRVNLQVGC